MPQDRTIKQRVTDPTPALFKQIRKWSLWAAAIGGILIGMNAGVPSLEIPLIITQIGEVVLYVGTAVAGVCTLTSTKAVHDTDGGN